MPLFSDDIQLSAAVDSFVIVDYSSSMKEIIESSVFKTWLSSLRDRRARVRIIQRIDRLKAGNAGDTKPIGEGLSELRIDYGPGYRVYYMQQGSIVVILLCGGTKRDQAKDITTAKALAQAWGEAT